jgi:multicomponent Na+:H+ antiporter subunit F
VIPFALFAMLTTAFFLAFLRLVIGPSLPDRVVALDLMASLSAGFTAVLAVTTREAVFLDLALVLSLTVFLGTVAFARFIEKGALPWRRS